MNNKLDTMSNNAGENSHAERIGRLEEAMIDVRNTLRAIVDSVKERDEKIDKSLGEIYKAVNSVQRTNWPSIWAGLTVLVAVTSGLWMMQTRPLEDGMARLERVTETLATNARDSQAQQQRLNDELVEVKTKHEVTANEVDAIYRNGSPITRERMAVLEYQVNQQILKGKRK